MLKIVKNSKTYVLPELSSLDGYGGNSIRTDEETMAFSHGVVETGDGKVDYKTLELEVYVIGVNQMDHDNQYNTLLRHLYQQNYKLYVREDRYINIARLNEIEHSFFDGYHQVRSKVTATLKANDPFFYDVTEIIERRTINDSPISTAKTLYVVNDSNVDVSPIITVMATNTCPSIIMANTTDDNRQFKYADLSLAAGVSVTIDGQTGTVYRGTANTLNAFSGAFLKLLAGENEITYTGENCIIDFKFTRRWL